MIERILKSDAVSLTRAEMKQARETGTGIEYRPPDGWRIVFAEAMPTGIRFLLEKEQP